MFAPHAEARLGMIQTRNELGWVAHVAPHDRSLVAHVRGGHGEQRLAGLERRDGCNVSRAEVRLGGLSFTSVVVGPTVRAPVAAVCAGPNVAGVSMVRTVQVSLVYISVLFDIIVMIIAGWTSLLACGFTAGSLGVGGSLSTRRVALLVLLLLLSLSWRGAAASGAG